MTAHRDPRSPRKLSTTPARFWVIPGHLGRLRAVAPLRAAH
ncbi:hypothetical protein PACID_05740 [Acidipropionibacterium acidipropionici ATCC 4875]|uniref:Uncharacterized protein n=1 Tax=Acidipropionibacterium acidipropionici (strain ATCC 4875 / DSM 20272 / JCM 6432 / NBRC 12425 / NCIMB 8070 / 4) TaxID=1171373 RepID=K7SGN0_ACIA4|nr:hypothetical protein PACID_05740 [Acidipropionibacterium acidipropionici ATCC 4875]